MKKNITKLWKKKWNSIIDVHSVESPSRKNTFRKWKLNKKCFNISTVFAIFPGCFFPKTQKKHEIYILLLLNCSTENNSITCCISLWLHKKHNRRIVKKNLKINFDELVFFYFF